MANDFVRFARSVEYSTGKKRGRHPVFNANRFYPHALERELASLAKGELERFLSECTEAALVGIPVRDDMEELSKVPETLPESFAAGVGGVAEKMRRKASTDFAEWSEMVVGKPYYPPEAEREIFSTWTANFQTLCKSAEADAKKDISLLVSSAKNEGWNRGRLEKSIRERLPSKYRARAENIARTELGKLNSAAKLSQFREVGISYYKWLTTIDGRERDSHRSMNGLICSVSNPGVYYTENPDDPLHPVEHPRTAGMFRGNPGEDFQCRCSMVAWDPEIDGMYEVRESPEGPDGKEETGTSPESAESERLGAELEKARREREEAETALESAENAKREAERNARTVEGRYRETISKMQVSEREAKKFRKAAERKEKALEVLDRENSMMAARLSEMEAKARFPEEEWDLEENVHISISRKNKGKQNKQEKVKFERELGHAKFLQKNGHSVWLVPETNNDGKHPDAIVDGIFTDFKWIASSKAEIRFLEGLEQAPIVCLFIKDSKLSLSRILGKLRIHKEGKAGRVLIVLNGKLHEFQISDL